MKKLFSTLFFAVVACFVTNATGTTVTVASFSKDQVTKELYSAHFHVNLNGATPTTVYVQEMLTTGAPDTDPANEHFIEGNNSYLPQTWGDSFGVAYVWNYVPGTVYYSTVYITLDYISTQLLAIDSFTVSATGVITPAAQMPNVWCANKTLGWRNLDEGTQCTITNMSGQVMLTNLSTTEGQLSLSEIPAGVYIATLQKGSSILNRKIVIQ